MLELLFLGFLVGLIFYFDYTFSQSYTNKRIESTVPIKGEFLVLKNNKHLFWRPMVLKSFTDGREFQIPKKDLPLMELKEGTVLKHMTIYQNKTSYFKRFLNLKKFKVVNKSKALFYQHEYSLNPPNPSFEKVYSEDKKAS